MKKIAFLVFVLCCAVAGSMAQGQTTLIRFEGQHITGIDAGGAWAIELIQGNATKAEITFPARFEDQLIFVLENGNLKLGFRGNIRPKSSEKFVARVVCSSLGKIDLSGACQVKGEGPFSGDKVEFELSGAAGVEFSDRLNVAKEVKIDNSGAAQLSADITTPHMDIELSGAAILTLRGKSDTAKADIAGAAKCNLEHMEVRRMEIDASGAAKLNLNVSEFLSGEASGAVKVLVKGNAKRQVSVSGAASVN